MRTTDDIAVNWQHGVKTLRNLTCIFVSTLAFSAMTRVFLIFYSCNVSIEDCSTCFFSLFCGLSTKNPSAQPWLSTMHPSSALHVPPKGTWRRTCASFVTTGSLILPGLPSRTEPSHGHLIGSMVPKNFIVQCFLQSECVDGDTFGFEDCWTKIANAPNNRKARACPSPSMNQDGCNRSISLQDGHGNISNDETSKNYAYE